MPLDAVTDLYFVIPAASYNCYSFIQFVEIMYGHRT